MFIVIRYHEIALKGGNRPFFVDRLLQNLRRAFSDVAPVTARSTDSRVTLELPDTVAWETARARLEGVFGIANFSRAQTLERDLEVVKQRAIAALESYRLLQPLGRAVGNVLAECADIAGDAGRINADRVVISPKRVDASLRQGLAEVEEALPQGMASADLVAFFPQQRREFAAGHHAAGANREHGEQGAGLFSLERKDGLGGRSGYGEPPEKINEKQRDPGGDTRH